MNKLVIVLLLIALSRLAPAAQPPIPLIFDTDMGNDIDDALALGMIHALQSRKECRLIAVTSTKDHDESGPYIDVINHFYGRGDIPIGVVRNGVTKKRSKYAVLANKRDGKKFRYPHDLIRGKDAPDAVTVLRQALAKQIDGTVVIAQVGFSTNLSRLLQSKPDKHSKLTGKELVAKKVKLLSVMAGAFALIGGKVHREYNIIKDIPAAQRLAREWPSPIVFSGFEIGLAVRYPAVSIQRDYRYVKHHPVAEGYHLYSPPPHNRPTWDLTSVLYCIRPNRKYFGLSAAGRVTVTDKGITTFAPEKNGKHRFLKLSKLQQPRVLEALVQLSSQPPTR